MAFFFNFGVAKNFVIYLRGRKNKEFFRGGRKTSWREKKAMDHPQMIPFRFPLIFSFHFKSFSWQTLFDFKNTLLFGSYVGIFIPGGTILKWCAVGSHFDSLSALYLPLDNVFGFPFTRVIWSILTPEIFYPPWPDHPRMVPYGVSICVSFCFLSSLGNFFLISI